MRLRRVAVHLTFALFLLAACGNGDDENEAAETGEAAGPPTAELRVGARQDEYVLEGERANLSMYPLNTNVVETLTYLTPQYDVEPLLAERWEFREPNTWRFHLRQGVTFHDGQPLNAQAVKAGLFDRVAAAGGGTINAGPDSAVVVDDRTIDFTPTKPNRRVPEQIVHPQNGVVAPGSDLATKPVGTGPFRFVDYRPKERIVVERNPDYWGDKARVARITFTFYPDSTVRRQALQSKDIDIALEVARPDVESLRSQGFNVEKSEVGAYRALYANIHGAPPHDILSDERVREAVAMGIDREKLVENVLDGLATTDQTMIPPKSLGRFADQVEGFRHDPVGAGRLLDEAGWRAGADGMRAKDGRPLRLVLVSGFGGAEIHRPVPAFLQSELKTIGVDLQIVEQPDSPSYQTVISSGEGDLYLEQGSQNDANPAFLPVLLFYTGGTGATAPYQKLFGPGPEFDKLIEPAVTAVDLEGVREAAAAAMSHIIDEKAVVLPLAGIFNIVASDASVEGIPAHPSLLSTRWEGVSMGGGS